MIHGGAHGGVPQQFLLDLKSTASCRSMLT
jgi:hypothetical protein